MKIEGLPSIYIKGNGASTNMTPLFKYVLANVTLIDIKELMLINRQSYVAMAGLNYRIESVAERYNLDQIQKYKDYKLFRNISKYLLHDLIRMLPK